MGPRPGRSRTDWPLVEDAWAPYCLRWSRSRADRGQGSCGLRPMTSTCATAGQAVDSRRRSGRAGHRCTCDGATAGQAADSRHPCRHRDGHQRPAMGPWPGRPRTVGADSADRTHGNSCDGATAGQPADRRMDCPISGPVTACDGATARQAPDSTAQADAPFNVFTLRWGRSRADRGQALGRVVGRGAGAPAMGPRPGRPRTYGYAPAHRTESAPSTGPRPDRPGAPSARLKSSVLRWGRGQAGRGQSPGPTSWAKLQVPLRWGRGLAGRGKSHGSSQRASTRRPCDGAAARQAADRTDITMLDCQAIGLRWGHGLAGRGQSGSARCGTCDTRPFDGAAAWQAADRPRELQGSVFGLAVVSLFRHG